MDVNINCTHIYYEWQYHLQSAYSSHSCQVSHLICRSLLQELFWNMWCLVSVLRHIKGKRKTVQTQSSLTFDTRFTGLLSAAGAWCAVNVKQGFVFFLFYDYYFFFHLMSSWLSGWVMNADLNWGFGCCSGFFCNRLNESSIHSRSNFGCPTKHVNVHHNYCG